MAALSCRHAVQIVINIRVRENTMPQVSAVVERTHSLDAACDLFLADLGDWVKTCIDRYRDALPIDIHDQATYASSWNIWIKYTNDPDASEFLYVLSDRISDYFQHTDQWHHGYWAQQEVHHGTEHFELFLNALYRLNPEHAATRSKILDACEHIGNWGNDCPDWFDWKTSLFRSTHLGTRTVIERPGHDINIPDHLRMINLSFLAFRVSGDSRYLDLAIAHCSRWADAINASDQIPVALQGEGWINQYSDEQRAVYGSFIEKLNTFDTDLDRAESFLASNGVDTFLEALNVTSDKKFLSAAERLLDVFATQLHDPDAGAAVDAIRRYRSLTGSNRYDSDILQAVADVHPENIGVISLDPAYDWGGRPKGIGKRKDMAKWYEDGEDRAHSPILLSLAAEISGDQLLARRSVEIARTYFRLATEAYPDGRDHGCSGCSVSAIARGHGRDNNAGVVSAVLEPMLSLRSDE
ncbi:hypothetical protein [Qingshengfaniella alkalisoli]|uniref:Uncharacterized protein n=1 Tax=Qingshengfaniella alkalisoli TaxID=2599296 RepID=A0A5B8IY38_9RHOB|nr:hypothetical protein [Qingshengfaniella alkalisoli]QDY70654.1 hypothetical protein FPZ52_13300 [Qingshengfaniella alkalisoli]